MSRLKTALRERWPALFLALRDLRYLLRHERLDPTTERLLAKISPHHGSRGGAVVQGGPFAGMVYGERALGSGLLPKVLGTYERELHGALEEAIARRPARLVNIGAGEGYYAVGLARRLPALAVFAYDIEPLASRAVPALAAANGAGARVHFGARCTHEDLRRLAGPGTLIVCDCEGCELALLDPVAVPGLARTDLLVELHERVDPALPATLLARFAPTHAVERFSAESRDGLDLPVLAGLTAEERRLAMDEGRNDGFQWAWLRAGNL